MKSKSIAIVAVCCAIAVICALVANYSPANIVPLAGCSLTFSLAFKKSSWTGGFICVFVTVALVGIICSITASFLFLAILFAPYSIFAYAIKNVRYTRKMIALRAGIMLVFFYATSLAVLLLCSALSFGVLDVLQGTSAYLVALGISVLCVPMDFMLDGVSTYVCNHKMLK